MRRRHSACSTRCVGGSTKAARGSRTAAPSATSSGSNAPRLGCRVCGLCRAHRRRCLRRRHRAAARLCRASPLGETAVLATTARYSVRPWREKGRFDEAEALLVERRTPWFGRSRLAHRSRSQARARVRAGRGEQAIAERLAREAVALAADTDMLAVHGAVLVDLASVVDAGSAEHVRALTPRSSSSRRRATSSTPPAPAPPCRPNRAAPRSACACSRRSGPARLRPDARSRAGCDAGRGRAHAWLNACSNQPGPSTPSSSSTWNPASRTSPRARAGRWRYAVVKRPRSWVGFVSNPLSIPCIARGRASGRLNTRPVASPSSSHV